MHKKLLLFSFCLSFLIGSPIAMHASQTYIVGNAQENKVINGRIVDRTNTPIIGANVKVNGSSVGTISDAEGNFSISAKPGDVLEISYIGYITQHVKVSGQRNMQIVLLEDNKTLDEVVVVGYGTLKKKLVTGATVQVKGDDIQKLSTTSIYTALQSQSPGLNITQTSGQPGDGFKVSIRGLGTIGNAGPLYVIDGVAGADINTLNPSDIESIDVLKDAASAAIYGARAANGVILVTTKQGKTGKIQFSYDGYVGSQYLIKKAPLLNAQQYMQVYDQLDTNEGRTPRNWSSYLPADLYNSIKDGTWKGTDWLQESYKKGANVMNHSINLVGGTDVEKFSLGFSYTNQDGIFGGPVSSKFKRYTFRINSDHTLLKNDKMDIIKIGETLTYKYSQDSGVALGNMYWNSIGDLMGGSPLLPCYTDTGDWYDQTAKYKNGWTLSNILGNPLALTALTSKGLNANKSWKLQGSAYLEIQPIKGLIFKSLFGYKYSSNSSRSMTKKYYLDENDKNYIESVGQGAGMGHSWTLDNTLSYTFQYNQHNVNVVVGQSVEKWGMGDNVSASGKNTLFESSWEHAYVDNTKPVVANDKSVGGSPWGEGTLASFFGRANYNYGEKYLAQFTLRADGSSNFAKGHRWGYFPSFSLGWIITNEDWIGSVKNWMDFFKLRASWGQNGNCNIAGFQYLTSYKFDVPNGYYFGKDKLSQSTGGYASILPNPDVSWEKSQQVDVGFDAKFLNSRLNVVFDLYNKKTKDWLVQAPILSIYGLSSPYINGGDIENKGFEIALGWNDKIGKDFIYGVSANLSYNKNKVTKISNAEGIIHGQSAKSGTNEMYRAQVGYPIGYFYGYETEGVFQNQQQIDEYKNAPVGSGKAALSTAQPGDLIFVDANKDGKINDSDRVKIGDPHPDYTVGFNFNCNYKGFDFSMTGAGAFGQQIYNSRLSIGSLYNSSTKILECWHGEGTSNKYPRLTSSSNANWQKFSKMYLENGDYLKMQNITLGYDFNRLLKQSPLSQLRLFVTVQNLFTITGYSGMDPEIGADGGTNSWVSGIDLGFYPNPRTWMIGASIKF